VLIHWLAKRQTLKSASKALPAWPHIQVG